MHLWLNVKSSHSFDVQYFITTCASRIAHMFTVFDYVSVNNLTCLPMLTCLPIFLHVYMFLVPMMR